MAITNDLRVFDPISGSYCYPDIVVVDNNPKFLDSEFDTLLNPIFVAEITSPSTEKRDLNDKFEIYKSIPSIKEYMIVAQDKTYIKHFKKITDNHWEFFEYYSIIENAILIDNKFTLPISAFYQKAF